MPEGEIRGKLDMEAQRDIWLSFKEIVTNIIKHAQCRSVKIEIRISRQFIEMVIADDGVGFDTGAATSRNGLKNIRARVDNLKAEYRLESNPGRGTQWTMRFKM
jgi:two-component system NarL family sensor kinase